MELEIKREQITDSVAKRRVAGKDLGGRRQTFTDSQIRNALRLIEMGEPTTEVARDLGLSSRPVSADPRTIDGRHLGEPDRAHPGTPRW